MLKYGGHYPVKSLKDFLLENKIISDQSDWYLFKQVSINQTKDR